MGTGKETAPRATGRRGRASRVDLKTIASAAMIAVMVVIAVLGTIYGGDILQESERERLRAMIDGSAWAPLAMIAVFIVGGVSGLLPQFVMIALAVGLFGPWTGFGLSWTGTLISATLGFLIGKKFGQRVFSELANDRANALSEKIGSHGILATLFIRIVPSGPFLIVNMAAGASHIPLYKFWIGSGLGTIPKMAVIAFGLSQFLAFLQKPDPAQLGLLAIVIGLWVAGGFWARKRIRRWQATKGGLAAVVAEAKGPTPDAGTALAGVALSSGVDAGEAEGEIPTAGSDEPAEAIPTGHQTRAPRPAYGPARDLSRDPGRNRSKNPGRNRAQDPGGHVSQPGKL